MKVCASTPAQFFGSDHIYLTVVYEQAFRGIGNASNFHSLSKYYAEYKQKKIKLVGAHVVEELYFWLASKVWLLVVAVNESLYLILDIQYLEHTIGMLVRL